jgi:hypothetical protein
VRNLVRKLLDAIEQARLVGYLSMKDITHVLGLRGLPPARPGARPPSDSASPRARRAA